MPVSQQLSSFDYAPSSGSFLRRTVYTSGSGIWTKGANTNNINFILIGPSGGTGGGPGAGIYGQASGPGGGLMKFLNVTAAPTGTYNLGAVGTGSSNSGAANATFVFNFVTYTASFGSAGADSDNDTAVSGGTGTNGDINLSFKGNVATSAQIGRKGGDAPFGLGNGGGANADGGGYGAGRGSASDATAHSGKLGILIIDEYT